MIAHWDEVEGRSRRMGHLGGTWRALAGAAGSVGVGLSRIEVPAGLWSTPAHVHGRQEEIFFVLGGSGLSWQDGETYEIGAGDRLVHRVNGRAHTLQAGPDGLDVLAFGTRIWDEAPTLTRADSVWLGQAWIVLAGEDDHPWAREVAAGPPELSDAPSERPGSIVHVDDERVPVSERDGETVARTRRALSAAAGSQLTGLQHVSVPPGKLNAAPHCHSAEEELFAVLDGEGELELTPGPSRRSHGAEDERHPVRRGDVIARPPGSGVAHTFRAGAGGLTLLAYGTREPTDVCYYQRSNKIFWRGVGVIGRIEHLDYWDGED
ncbi:MAG: cupin domain-containing protein [Gaiellaceae bacterium]